MRLNSVKEIELNSNSDERGVLTAVEGSKDIPISIERVFYIHDTKADRGGHAHIDTDQVLIPVAGNFTIILNDGESVRQFEMKDPAKALYIPRLIFVEFRNFSKDAVCLVLANTHYDRNKSLRSFEEFMDHINQNRNLEY